MTAVELESLRQITLALSTALYKTHGERAWDFLAETTNRMFELNILNDPAAIMYLDIMTEKKGRPVPAVV